MAEFFLTKNVEPETSAHLIHKTTCTQLPEINTMTYLGSFASGEAAHSKARGLFDSIQYCSSCFSK